MESIPLCNEIQVIIHQISGQNFIIILDKFGTEVSALLLFQQSEPGLVHQVLTSVFDPPGLSMNHSLDLS